MEWLWLLTVLAAFLVGVYFGPKVRSWFGKSAR